MGHDPAGWLGVDPKTGDVTLVKSPDRESPHVVDGVYTATLLAVDSGEAPPLKYTCLEFQSFVCFPFWKLIHPFSSTSNFLICQISLFL